MWQVARKGTRPITLVTLKNKKINMKTMNKHENINKTPKHEHMDVAQCHFNKRKQQITA